MSLFGKKDEIDSARHHSDQRPRPRYGIAEAILLMRSLPVDQNVELVVRTIRNTLESLNVHLGDIIEDGIAKEKAINQRIENLRSEIADLSKQVEARGQEINRLETELSETSMVKERLQLAQHRTPPAPPARAAQQSDDVVTSVPPNGTKPERSVPVPPPVKSRTPPLAD